MVTLHIYKKKPKTIHNAEKEIETNKEKKTEENL